MKLKLSCIIFIIITQFFYAQETAVDDIARKQITAQRISAPIKIDGIIDEKVWNNAEIAQNFVERNPDNGKPEPENHKTKIKILYDDTGI